MWKTVLTSFVSAVLGGLLVFFAMNAVAPADTGQTVNLSKVVRQQKSAGELSAEAIYENFAPGVVHIKSTFTQNRSSDFFGFIIPLPSQEKEASGSGFVIDKSGLIVTNAHVVQDSRVKASKIMVLLNDKDEVEAKLLGTDPSTDIAVLKIDPGKRNLKVLELGDSSKLKVGDTVYAIGSPFELNGTMTQGIVSAINRTIDSADRRFQIRGAIQTDAAVNPGNSGGPLLNAFGEVVGINSQIYTQSGDFAGIAFAIPSNTVKQIAEQISKNGKASHPWIGIAGREMDKAFADLVKAPVDKGVMVIQVMPGGPADKAGLRGSQVGIDTDTGEQYPVGGDIIVKIGNVNVTNMDDLLDFIDKHKVGEKIPLEIYRDGKRMTLKLELGERPEN
ncbi:MAG: trypsin-like peptidase domain-containing protein [Firmicutes bacterium]|nr:trypsin-like peptidase domain-containing protein [Bacillota bacterium]